MLGDQRLIAMSRYGNEDAASVERASRGNGMLIEMKLGSHGGRVIHAGSCEWCVGLQAGREEPLTEMVTRNILDSMLGATDVAEEANNSDVPSAKL
eukprot:COSAG05_NODE_956_length_6433_cov_1.774708_3_plen_96_part_00